MTGWSDGAVLDIEGTKTVGLGIVVEMTSERSDTFGTEGISRDGETDSMMFSFGDHFVKGFRECREFIGAKVQSSEIRKVGNVMKESIENGLETILSRKDGRQFWHSRKLRG